MRSDKISYEFTHEAFAYVTSIKAGELLNKDSVQKHMRWMMNTTGLITNNGRYEGFKSSGKIINIENKELQNNILDLYQEDIPSLLLSTNAYTKRKEILFQFGMDNAKRNKDGSNNAAEFLSTDKGQAICSTLVYTGEIMARYDTVINKSQRIIALIDKELE
jgi:hypothetical protein